MDRNQSHEITSPSHHSSSTAHASHSSMNINNNKSVNLSSFNGSQDSSLSYLAETSAAALASSMMRNGSSSLHGNANSSSYLSNDSNETDHDNADDNSVNDVAYRSAVTATNEIMSSLLANSDASIVFPLKLNETLINSSSYNKVIEYMKTQPRLKEHLSIFHVKNLRSGSKRYFEERDYVVNVIIDNGLQIDQSKRTREPKQRLPVRPSYLSALEWLYLRILDRISSNDNITSQNQSTPSENQHDATPNKKRKQNPKSSTKAATIPNSSSLVDTRSSTKKRGSEVLIDSDHVSNKTTLQSHSSKKKLDNKTYIMSNSSMDEITVLEESNAKEPKQINGKEDDELKRISMEVEVEQLRLKKKELLVKQENIWFETQSHILALIKETSSLPDSNDKAKYIENLWASIDNHPLNPKNGRSSNSNNNNSISSSASPDSSKHDDDT